MLSLARPPTSVADHHTPEHRPLPRPNSFVRSLARSGTGSAARCTESEWRLRCPPVTDSCLPTCIFGLSPIRKMRPSLKPIRLPPTAVRLPNEHRAIERANFPKYLNTSSRNFPLSVKAELVMFATAVSDARENPFSSLSIRQRCRRVFLLVAVVNSEQVP